MASQAASEAASTMRTEQAKKVEKANGAGTGSIQKMKRTKSSSDTSQATSRPVQKPASSVPQEAAVKQQAGTDGQGTSSANQESTGANHCTGGGAGLTRENWTEMLNIDYNQAEQLCFSVAPLSKKDASSTNTAGAAVRDITQANKGGRNEPYVMQMQPSGKVSLQRQKPHQLKETG